VSLGTTAFGHAPNSFLEVVSMCASQRVAAVVTMLMSLLVATSSLAGDQAAFEKRMGYLREIEEVAWVEINNNHIYIGFKRRPSDLAAIVNAAAVVGNRTLDFGVHVWAVPDGHSGWRPGDGPYYCKATARHGKLTDACE
jgi:hypothetical protein